MRMSPRTRVAGWGAAALLMALVLLAALVLWRGALVEEAWAAEEDALHLGVVDLDSLLQAHPDAERLQQIDQQLDLLRQELELIPITEIQGKQREAQAKMRAELEKSRKSLEGEAEAIRAELEGLGAAMAAQLKAEGESLQRHYEDQLKREVGALQPPDLGKSAQQKMEDFLADLNMVRNQRMTAKRLEIEREVQSKLESERQRVDAELAAYETELMRENQQKKLNLQLEMQVVEDPEKEAALQQQLSELGDAEHAAKEARRAELFAALDQLNATERAGMESRLASYEKQLNTEVQQKAAAERNRLAGMPAPSSGTPPDIQRRIDQIKVTINSEMAARKAQMESQMQARQAEAQARLQAKQKKIEERLKVLADEMRRVLEKAQDDLSEPSKKKMEALKAQIEQAEAERNKIYEGMVADLSDKVGAVAKKANVVSVIGKYVENVSLPDLTDQAMVSIKNAPAR